ncbi:hypothetical protein [Kitasatospora purpeofusca]|uniref:hypothetical protein n=1 Tax=Kitasatospora purpeofusca TaxID=67352 RepID=UPI003F4AD8D5
MSPVPPSQKPPHPPAADPAPAPRGNDGGDDLVFAATGVIVITVVGGMSAGYTVNDMKVIILTEVLALCTAAFMSWLRRRR